LADEVGLAGRESGAEWEITGRAAGEWIVTTYATKWGGGGDL